MVNARRSTGEYMSHLEQTIEKLETENAKLWDAVKKVQHENDLFYGENIKLREALEEIADIVALYKDGRETAVYEIVKAALGESDDNIS